MTEGQINISTTYPEVVRAFHRHQKQDDNWYIVSGQFEIVLIWTHDFEYGSGLSARSVERMEKHYLGPGESIRIVPNVWHGFRVLGTEPGTLLYWVTGKYDPDNPDEERAIWDQWYNWTTEFK